MGLFKKHPDELADGHTIASTYFPALATQSRSYINASNLSHVQPFLFFLYFAIIQASISHYRGTSTYMISLSCFPMFIAAI